MNRAAPVLSFVALLLALATVLRSAETEPRRPRPGSMGAMPLKLLRVEERSITVRAALGTDKEAPAEQTFAVDRERTRVTVGEVTAERKTDGGQVVRSVKSRPASLADLKVGQTIRVGTTDGVATRIDIMPPPPAKDDGRGADKKDSDRK